MAICALVGASDFNGGYFREYEARNGAYDHVIAVDGGYASLAAVGRMPDVLVGDFDSLSGLPPDVSADVRIERHPTHKDASDMELAILCAQRLGFDALHIYGALGGRLDHTLANLQLFAGMSEQGLRITAIDVARSDGAFSGEVEGRSDAEDRSDAKGDHRLVAQALTFLTGPAELSFPALGAHGKRAARTEGEKAERETAACAEEAVACTKGESDPGRNGIVSVFAMSDEAHGVTERGLVYPLDDATLTNHTSLGLSNEMCGQDASVSVREGTIVVFHPLEH